MPSLKDDRVDCTGELIARYYKYYQQFQNSKIHNKLPFNRVSAKCLYSENSTRLDKLSYVINKYCIDVSKFMKFFVLDFNKCSKTIDDVFKPSTFKAYIDDLDAKAKYRKIYDSFMKSVNNIVNDCRQLQIYSTKDYLKHIFSEHKISSYYLSGKISIYWFAAIPKFKKIIENLDDISKDEMHILYDRYDVYNSLINEAFLRIRNIKVNPFKFTDDRIFDSIEKQHNS